MGNASRGTCCGTRGHRQVMRQLTAHQVAVFEGLINRSPRAIARKVPCTARQATALRWIALCTLIIRKRQVAGEPHEDLVQKIQMLLPALPEPLRTNITEAING